jgi:hypothetical protein
MFLERNRTRRSLFSLFGSCEPVRSSDVDCTLGIAKTEGAGCMEWTRSGTSVLRPLRDPLGTMANDFTPPENPKLDEPKPVASEVKEDRRVVGAVNSALQRPMHLGISSRLNGLLDYAVALILFIAPWFLGYADHAVTPVSRALGAALLFYSLSTKYELGIIKMIPLQVHLFLDLGTGGLLAAAPIHFNIRGLPGMVFFILGVSMLASALLTHHGHKFTKATTGPGY